MTLLDVFEAAWLPVFPRSLVAFSLELFVGSLPVAVGVWQLSLEVFGVFAWYKDIGFLLSLGG